MDRITTRSEIDVVAPAFMTPPHAKTRDGMYVWATSPNGIVIQAVNELTATRKSTEELIFDLAPRLLSDEPAYFIHDYRSVSRYEPGVPRLYVAWAVRIRKQVREIVMIEPKLNRMIRMALSVALASIRVAGIEIRITPSLIETVTSRGLKAGEGVPLTGAVTRKF